MVRGMPGLVLLDALGVPLPLVLVAVADGEWWEDELLGGDVVASKFLYRFRHLRLSEKVLLAKPATPELIGQLWESDSEETNAALKQVERLSLRGRSLRGAVFEGASLPGADLREAQLQGAIFMLAQLLRADFRGANLRGTNLVFARVHGAQLQRAHLQGADLEFAELPGADLQEAHLQGADLQGADLQGADVQRAHLQGADLRGAKLQGADLRGARLQGADLQGADLQGADLRSAELYGAYMEQMGSVLVDLCGTRWMPLAQESLTQIRKTLDETITGPEVRKAALERIERAGQPGLAPPTVESCLIDPEVTAELNCRLKWLPAGIEALIVAFRRNLFPELEKLACRSSWTARGLIRQIEMSDTSDGRFGLAGRFEALLSKQECDGLSFLPAADKARIRDLAMDEEERREQSSAGKSMQELPASPTPPPAIAPYTP